MLWRIQMKEHLLLCHFLWDRQFLGRQSEQLEWHWTKWQSPAGKNDQIVLHLYIPVKQPCVLSNVHQCVFLQQVFYIFVFNVLYICMCALYFAYCVFCIGDLFLCLFRFLISCFNLGCWNGTIYPWGCIKYQLLLLEEVSVTICWYALVVPPV